MSEQEKVRILWWFIGAMLGSVGLNQGIQKSYPIRHDPFTGSEAKHMERRIDMLESKITVIEWRLNNADP